MWHRSQSLHSAFAQVRRRSLTPAEAATNEKWRRTRANERERPQALAMRRSWVRVPSSAMKDLQNSRYCRLNGQRFKPRGKVEGVNCCLLRRRTPADGSRADRRRELLPIHRAVRAPARWLDALEGPCYGSLPGRLGVGLSGSSVSLPIVAR